MTNKYTRQGLSTAIWIAVFFVTAFAVTFYIAWTLRDNSGNKSIEQSLSRTESIVSAPDISPTVALKHLIEVGKDNGVDGCESVRPINDAPCPDISDLAYLKYNNAKDELIFSVYKRGTVDDFIWLLSFVDGSTKDLIERRIVEEARKSNDPSMELLLAAGTALESGRSVQRDTLLSIKYMTLAWRKGAMEAPKHLVDASYRLGDFEGAYLWALRCTGVCKAERGLDDIEQMIAYDRRAVIQKESLMPF